MIICEEVLEGNETEECCLCTVTKMVLPFLDEPRVKKMASSIYFLDITSTFSLIV